MKKNVLVAFMAFMCVVKSFAYDKVIFTNYTKKSVNVEVSYLGATTFSCSKDKFSVAAGATGSPSASRGACLISSISATGATSYTSTGTSYSRFGLIELNGKLEVHRVDEKGTPLDVASVTNIPAATVVTPQNIDEILQPGDYLFKYVVSEGKTEFLTSVFQKIINYGQQAFTIGSQKWNDYIDQENLNFKKAMAKGDPNVIHMALYVGKGMLAEANGTTMQNAAVKTESIFTAHKGEVWKVFRHKDKALSQDVSKVASLWANERMKYLIPVKGILTNANFGPQAMSQAVQYGEAYNVKGGPKSVTSMFCSQFAVAASQSAALNRLMVSNGKSAKDNLVNLPIEFKLDSYASPCTVYGVWEKSNAFSNTLTVIAK